MGRGYLGLLSLGVALMVAGLGIGVAQAQQTATVSLTSFQFAPANLTATAGQPVSWTFRNEDQNNRPHDFRVEIGGQTIDAVAGDGNVMPGQSVTFTQTFTTPGTYEFWCPVGMHRQQGMVGRLTVTAAGGAAAAQPSAQMPASLPRTGELSVAATGLLAAGAGAASLVTGLLMRARRRRD